MAVSVLNQSNFEETVLRSDKPVLVDFWASWCGPCKMLSPIVEQLAQEHPELSVCKVNVDEQPALAQRYNIMGIPALLFFQDGKMVRSTVGLQPKAALEQLIR